MLRGGLMLGGAALGGSTTWNPADKDAAVTLSSGNRVMAVAGASAKAVRSTTSYAASSGKFFAEATILAAGDIWVGTGKGAAALTNYVGSDIHAVGYRNNGGLYQGGSSLVTYATYVPGDILGLAVNTANGNLWWSKNGIWQAGNPAAGTGASVSWDTLTTIYIMASADNGGSVSLNCGQDAFIYDMPPGFAQWG